MDSSAVGKNCKRGKQAKIKKSDNELREKHYGTFFNNFLKFSDLDENSKPSETEEGWKSSSLSWPFLPCNAQPLHFQYHPSAMNKHFGKMIL